MPNRSPSNSCNVSSGGANSAQSFERIVLRHLDAAYNLAHWLTRNSDDAGDVVQKACAQATRCLHAPRHESERTWLLHIVRHTCLSWLKERRAVDIGTFDDTEFEWAVMGAPPCDGPPAVEAVTASRAQIDAAVAKLPVAYREVLVLRELEDLSYSEIARVADIPIETVMSRLSYARNLVRTALTQSSIPRLG